MLDIDSALWFLAIDNALVLSTMRFRDELVSLDEYEFPEIKNIPPKQLQLAKRLIDEFAAEWDPDKYTDDYRENIMRVVHAKRDKVKPELEPEMDPQSAQVVDLMERLRKSLGTKRAYTAKAAKAPRASKARGRKTARKSARRTAVSLAWGMRSTPADNSSSNSCWDKPGPVDTGTATEVADSNAYHAATCPSSSVRRHWPRALLSERVDWVWAS